MTESDVIKLLQADTEFMEVAKSIAALNIPNWCIFSGFVRNKVWDHIHGNSSPTKSSDVDLAIYAPANEKLASTIYQRLKTSHPTYEWDISNLAFTHIENGDEPYTSLYDGLSKELDTIMSIGFSLDQAGQLAIASPHGIEDLINCTIRPTPIIYAHPERRQLIADRIAAKQMLAKWPLMQVVI